MDLLVYCVLLMTAVQVAVAPDAPLYSVGRIPNVVCTGTNGLTGICNVKGECLANGGIPNGNCNSVTKQAVCCIYTSTCGGSGSNNITYFQNAGYPAPFNGATSCSYTVVPDNTICQLRIDFSSFRMAQPTSDGICSTDKLTVSGGGSSVPTICGDNTGQHMYVPFSGTSPITLTVDTTGSYSLKRTWNLQLSLISCTSQYKAPSGCLQYFLDSTGEVASFNYDSNANSNLNANNMPGSRQMANLNYGICIRAGAKQCSISYSLPSGDPYAFTVSGDVQGMKVADLAGPKLAKTGTMCTTDYLIIPNPNPGVLTDDRFCGMGLPVTPVIGSTAPFALFYVTNADEAVDTANRGFKLQYSQNNCKI